MHDSELPLQMDTQPLDKASPREDVPEDTAQPTQIGRYRVERVIGEGGFGRVYLAFDEQLERPVAVKVPHRRLVRQVEDVERYIAEARTVAKLEHPHIVPVYDVGSTDEHPFFFVSKFIEGTTLSQRIRDGGISQTEAVDLVATLADALHYAHRNRIVHRDVKPSNILLEGGSKPYLTDFGLALREQDIGKGPRKPGTPAYMSPEQARGEGHRVDGRSDIFGLGVVFYQLLTGQQPFQADSKGDLLEQIISHDPRPPRQLDDTIPPELERICLKALSKRAVERYSTAKDMGDELRAFFLQQTVTQPAAILSAAKVPNVPPSETPPSNTPGGQGSSLTLGGSASEDRPVRIIPKGLRSFDAHDADFFLELLPGPRDRNGLPDSIRFWKTHIEETDAEQSFTVGLIYGPSGCGKSSLVKAGLLPRLSDDVVSVYYEATAAQTEARLLHALRKRFPSVPGDVDLKDTVKLLRRGRGLPANQKVLIVIDQFEQWLHAHREERDSELVQALRQCDGVHVQCLLMVRDDFWLAISRFMRELEIRLLEGQNSALVDLFDLDHARKVLTAFGRAYSRLPENSSAITRPQKDFLNQAVKDLASESKVVCVRLSLFAEMMKSKPWTLASLKELGGAQGVGVTFLEETFSAQTAPPEHRFHQRAARAVLEVLLPESGSDIKGHLRSADELLEACSYAAHPEDFQDLLRILDSDIRLITPTDPAGVNPEGPARAPTAGGKYYQLTHDYLVPAVRDWLTRKQRETWKGRAELRLADRAAAWNAKAIDRLLPAWWEWLNIRLLTRPRDWTPSQRKMMQRARLRHGASGLVLLLILALATWGVWDFLGRLKADNLRDHLLSAVPAEVPGIIASMAPYRGWLDPHLREALAQAQADKEPGKQLKLSLALLPSDPGQVDYLFDRLLTCESSDFAMIRSELCPHRGELIGRLWETVADYRNNSDRRFRAACALALYAPDDPRWSEFSEEVMAKLLTEDSFVWRDWQSALQPVKRQMLAPLAKFLEDSNWETGQRPALVDLYRVFSGNEPAPLAPLEERLSKVEEAGLAPVATAKRKANLIAALFALGKTQTLWPLLRHTPDPTLRSCLIERVGVSAADPSMLIRRLAIQEKDPSARRALILTLGAFEPQVVPDVFRILLDLYQNDPDPGIHGAAGWVLRKWKQDAQIAAIDQTLATGKREAGRNWYVTKNQMHTFSVIRPTTSPADAEKKRKTPTQAFAIAATEVTVEQYLRFNKEHKVDKSVILDAKCPVNMVPWYQALEYCNWLSKLEGLPECYQRNKEGLLEAFPDYRNRKGYRLPAEDEWEFACRAGAETPMAFGEADEELTSKYEWWYANSYVKGAPKAHPVASLKPNDWGLFDMHGNVQEYCQEWDSPDASTPVTTQNAAGQMVLDSWFAYRGGAFSTVECGTMTWAKTYKTFRNWRGFRNVGFRPVRTLDQ